MRVKQNGIHSGQTRIFAFVCLLCFALLLTGSLILSHAEHEHYLEGDGGGCTVCAVLHGVAGLLKIIGAATVGVPLELVILFSAMSLLFVAFYCYYSPVKLKIRINC